MKITRSTKCSLKFSTNSKKEKLKTILEEYSKTVNFFIDFFWNKKDISKRDLTKDVFNIPETWLSARMKQVAAREALDMIKSTKEVLKSNIERIELNILSMQNKITELQNKSNLNKSKEENDKEKKYARINRRKINNLYKKIKRNKMKAEMMQPRKPKHKGKRMCLSALICHLQDNKESTTFNSWLHLNSIGNKISLDIPILFHKHFKKLKNKGKMLNSYIITKDYVQFAFEIETGPKKEVKNLIGIDSGVNALASTSENKQFGLDIKEIINKIESCKRGSKRQKRLKLHLKYRICEVAKQTIEKSDLVVVEKLKNLNVNSKLKGRLSQTIRSVIGNWNYSYWLERLEMACEDNRVSFRTVSPYYTSQKCFKCGYTDKANRDAERFECRKCYHTGNADINAASNILKRFVTGKYGSCYKAWFNEKFMNCTSLA